MLSEKQILKTSGIIWKAIENIHDEEKHQATDADACDICLNSYPIRIAVWAEAQSKSNLLADWSKDGFIINFLQHCLTEVAATPTQATPIATAQRTLLESLDQVIGYLQERRSKTTLFRSELE